MTNSIAYFLFASLVVSHPRLTGDSISQCVMLFQDTQSVTDGMEYHISTRITRVNCKITVLTKNGAWNWTGALRFCGARLRSDNTNAIFSYCLAFCCTRWYSNVTGAELVDIVAGYHFLFSNRSVPDLANHSWWAVKRNNANVIKGLKSKSDTVFYQWTKHYG